MSILDKIMGGANQFSSELLRPTSALGQLGAYLGAAGGGALGEASLAAQKQDQDTQFKQFQLLSTLAKANKPTSLQQDLAAAGIMEGTPEFKAAVLNATSRGLPTGYQFAAGPNGQMTPAPIGGVLTPEGLADRQDQRATQSQAAAEQRALQAQAAAEARQQAMFAHMDAAKQAGGGMSGAQKQAALKDAANAISRGAPRDKVLERLRANGIEPAGF